MRKILIGTAMFSLVASYCSAQIYANDSLIVIGEQSSNQNFIITSSINESSLVGKKEEFPDVSTFYKISSLEAANFDQRHTNGEIAAFKQEAANSFQKFNYFINIEKGQLIRQNRINGNFKVFNVSSDNETIRIVSCETCDQVIFNIIENSANHLIFADRAQDEGQYFDFIYSFTK